MCPPVSVRRVREGMTYLYSAWMYQLQHGEPLRLCFPCFKVAFMDLKESLESDEWEEEEWDSESEEGPAQAGLGTGAGGGQGPVQPMQPMQGILDDQNDLEPQDLVHLSPENDDWTQALPWRFQALPPCIHWPRPPPPWQVSVNVDPSHEEPMLLEVGTTCRVDPREAEAWLLGLQLVSMVACSDTVYLRKMAPDWALKTSGQRWKVLLEPGEVWAVRLPGLPPQQDLLRWKLSVLERIEQGTVLVPADSALQKRGFTVVSYSPWSKRETGEAASAPTPQCYTPGPGPSTSEPWGSGPRRPGESLAILGDWGLGDRPYFLPLGPGLQN